MRPLLHAGFWGATEQEGADWRCSALAHPSPSRALNVHTATMSRGQTVPGRGWAALTLSTPPSSCPAGAPGLARRSCLCLNRVGLAGFLWGSIKCTLGCRSGCSLLVSAEPPHGVPSLAWKPCAPDSWPRLGIGMSTTGGGGPGEYPKGMSKFIVEGAGGPRIRKE